MKKNIFAVLAILFTGFYSCSSDNDVIVPGPEETPKEILEYPYSQLSATDQKKKLSAEGEATLNQIEGVASENSALLLHSFNEISGSLFDVLGSIDNDDVQVTPGTRSDVSKVIKLSQYHGEYSWNAATEEWTKSDKEATKLILHFPAKKGSIENNGKMEITAITSTVNIDGREIPSNVVADLYVADKKEGEITAIATGINETTYASTADVNVTFGTYKLAFNLNKKDAKNATTVDFTKGTDAILKAYADLEANVTASMLDAEDVSSVKDANFVVNVSKDIATAGYVDGKSLIAEFDRLKVAYKKEIEGVNLQAPADLKQAKAQVEALNKFSNIALASVSEEYKIAKVYFRLHEGETYEWKQREYLHDENGSVLLDENGAWMWEEVLYSYQEDMEIKMVFLFEEDGSPVEADIFFGEGFSKVITMWEDFASKFN